MNYIEIANNDLQFYRESMERCTRNAAIIVQGQQVVEKFLKGILDILQVDKHSPIYRTHSIKALVAELSKHVSDWDYTEIKKADGYYFNVRYPGDDFFVPIEADYMDMQSAVDNCVDLVQHILSRDKKDIEELAEF